jgi:hypothetical protein
MKAVHEYDDLDELLVDTICHGPVNEIADRARKNVKNFTTYKILDHLSLINRSQQAIIESQHLIIDLQKTIIYRQNLVFFVIAASNFVCWLLLLFFTVRGH